MEVVRCDVIDGFGDGWMDEWMDGGVIDNG